MTEKTCETCGKIFIKLPSHSKKYFIHRKYCSLKCRPTDFRNKPIKGSKNWQWKGGRIKHTKGYILILKPEHPFCNKDGYILEHRLVMEKTLGRYLKPSEYIHHKGIHYPIGVIENLQDNNPENLYLCTNNAEHRKLHLKDFGYKKCKYCNKLMKLRETLEITRRKFCNKKCQLNFFHSKK